MEYLTGNDRNSWNVARSHLQPTFIQICRILTKHPHELFPHIDAFENTVLHAAVSPALRLLVTGTSRYVGAKTAFCWDHICSYPRLSYTVKYKLKA
jgi:hypothetical protein